MRSVEGISGLQAGEDVKLSPMLPAEVFTSALMSTLINRVRAAYTEAAGTSWTMDHEATRSMLELLAAELVVAGHRDAAGWLLGQLTAEVIPLRAEGPGGVA